MDELTFQHGSTQHRFICGNSIAAMETLDAQSVGLIVTSPPYGIGLTYGKYDDTLSLDEYRAFARAWMAEAARLLTDDGSLWVNIGYTKLSANETYPLSYLYHEIARELGLKLVQEVTWAFSSGQSYSRRFAHRSERWLWLTRDPDAVRFNLDAVRVQAKRPDRRNNPLGKNPGDVWIFEPVKGNSREKTAHPCQFPVEMIERIVRACSPVNGLVIDPFGGSGSTTMAAARNGRNSVYLDLDPEYTEIAIDRLTRPALRAYDPRSWLRTLRGMVR